MRGFRRALCTCDTLSEAPFAGTGAETRSTIVDTGAHDSDSAPSSRPPGPSQSRSEARCVCLARSSCAVATSGQAAQGYPLKKGPTPGAAFFWLLFLAAQEKLPATGLPPVAGNGSVTHVNYNDNEMCTHPHPNLPLEGEGANLRDPKMEAVQA